MGLISLRNFLKYLFHIFVLSRCAELCSEKSDCQSFEFSLQNAACSFNLEVDTFCLFIQLRFADPELQMILIL